MDTLLKFSKRLKESNNAMKEFSSWNMAFDANLIQVPGRILPQVSIIFDGTERSVNQEKAEWGIRYAILTYFQIDSMLK